MKLTDLDWRTSDKLRAGIAALLGAPEGESVDTVSIHELATARAVRLAELGDTIEGIADGDLAFDHANAKEELAALRWQTKRMLEGVTQLLAVARELEMSEGPRIVHLAHTEMLPAPKRRKAA